MHWGFKARLLKAEFYINIITRFRKKITKWSLLGDGTEETALDFEILNLRSNDPHVYELNVVNTERD